MDRTPQALDDTENYADPYERLVCAVLLRAIRDYQFSRARNLRHDTYALPHNACHNGARNHAREAALWLFAPHDEPWSAKWCCEQLGIAITRLRYEIITGRHLDVLNDRRITVRYNGFD